MRCPTSTRSSSHVPHPLAANTPPLIHMPQVDAGKEINVLSAINEKVITRGLKYSLATGNWGEQGKQGIRAGG